MNNLLNDYGILFLVILFIAISLYYKNFVNIANKDSQNKIKTNISTTFLINNYKWFLKKK